MPTDIDSLQIGISASSKSAETSIDNLIRSLGRLKTSLSLGTNVSNYDNAMKSIATNMNDVSTAIKSIDTDVMKDVTKNFKQLAKSISILAGASEKLNFNNASSSANSFIQVAKQGAQEVAKQFGITDAKAIERLEQKFIALGNAVNKNSTAQHTIFDDIVDDVNTSKNVMKAFPQEYANIVQTIQNANKNMKITLPFSGSEFSNDYASMRSQLGKAFTGGNANGMSTKSFDKFLSENFSDSEIQAIESRIISLGGNVGNLADTFRALVDIKKQYNTSSQASGAVMESEHTSIDALENSVIESVNAFSNLTSALGQVNLTQGQTVNLFEQLATNLNAFQGVNIPDMTNLSTLADSIAKFGYKSATQGAESIRKVANELPTLITSLNGVGSLTFQAQGLADLGSAIAKLGSKNATNASNNIPLLVGNLRTLISEMNQIQGVTFDATGLIDFAKAVSKLGSVTSGRAVANIPQLTKELMNMMNTLKNAPQVSQNLIDMTNAMGNLGSSARSLTSGSTNNGFKNLFNTIFKGSNKAGGGMKSLAYYFGKFYANFWLLRRGFGLIKSSVDYASDLVEVQNVVDHSFGALTDRVDDFAKNSIQAFGMSELTAKQIASRYQAMGVAMGITNAQVKASNSTWSSHSEELEKVGQQYNDTAESMADISINLTKLAADIGSFYNEEYDVVAERLQSVFTGQTRPLRAYGLDLTQATLKEWALNQGLEANFKTMTQAEKTMLRYQYVMAHTAEIQGDLIRTSSRRLIAA